MNLNALLNSTIKVGRKLMPVVLLAAGTAFAVDAIVKTPECYEESNEILVEEERALDRELEPVEKVKATWRAWTPVLWREFVSLVCFYGAFYMKHKRGAAIAVAYALLERERDDLDAAIREKLGPAKYEEMRHEMMDRQIENALSKSEDICVGEEEALGVYFDPFSGKIFKCDPRKVKEAWKDMDTEYGINGFVSLNDFYKRIGIKTCGNGGDYVGWEYHDGEPMHLPDLRTYDYYWDEKGIYITGLDFGLRLDKFVRTWY